MSYIKKELEDYVAEDGWHRERVKQILDEWEKLREYHLDRDWEDAVMDACCAMGFSSESEVMLVLAEELENKQSEKAELMKFVRRFHVWHHSVDNRDPHCPICDSSSDKDWLNDERRKNWLIKHGHTYLKEG